MALCKGDLVTVKFPELVDGIPKGLLECNNKEYRISRMWKGCYELEGAVSGMGVPYTFMKEWIFKS